MRKFPAKNGWQDALQKLREENAGLKKQIATLTEKLLEKERIIIEQADWGKCREEYQQEIVALTAKMRKYKAFWEQSREVEKMNFERFEWEPLGREFQKVLNDVPYEDEATDMITSLKAAVKEKGENYEVALSEWTESRKEILLLQEQIAVLKEEIKGWRRVIRECERLLCDDEETARSPLMSNLPNLIRDKIAALTFKLGHEKEAVGILIDENTSLTAENRQLREVLEGITKVTTLTAENKRLREAFDAYIKKMEKLYLLPDEIKALRGEEAGG